MIKVIKHGSLKDALEASYDVIESILEHDTLTPRDKELIKAEFKDVASVLVDLNASAYAFDKAVLKIAGTSIYTKAISPTNTIGEMERTKLRTMPDFLIEDDEDDEEDEDGELIDLIQKLMDKLDDRI